MKKTLLFILLLFSIQSLFSQRMTENIDRGIIAMPKSSSQIYISWRHLATDPEGISYNIYYKTSPTGALTLINTSPVTNSTNYLANLSTTTSAFTFVIKSIYKGIEKEEPGSFTLPRNTISSRIIKDFNFQPLPAGHPVMPMKFCWPADLDGDGQFDFVLDRQNYGAVSEDGSGGGGDYPSPKIEAYSSEGKFLWRVDMGYNVKICNGHADMVTAFDMDGDGKAEVIMAVSEGTTFADGKVVTAANGTVTDYRTKAGSAPQWISIINGETGIEIDRIVVPFYNEMATTRTDDWKDINGHFIIAYLDGIKPSLIYQYKNRQSNNSFTGSHAAWSYSNGKLVQKWANRFYSGQAEFHQVRAGDVDGDGFDEFIEGGYALDQDGSLLYRAAGVVHGDRHCLADIDPDRPGLEHFFIQQDNPNTLGMGYHDAATGEIIRGLYMSGVGDVGRGICAAFDNTRRGMQFWSTMNGYAVYDSKGTLIQGATGNFPSEAIWWGSDLSRWSLNGVNSSGSNVAFNRYNPSTKGMERVTPNLYNEDNGHGAYYFAAAYGARAAFWGDILGDWREEMIFSRSNGTGFVVLSTWDVTAKRLYSLIQNPAYRCQTTARGYYQTADVDYYMAFDMPKPPVAPVQKADVYLTSENTITASVANEKSIMLDLRNQNKDISINENISPSVFYLMNPKGKNITISGQGKITGNTEIIKSMKGDITLNGNHEYIGITRISEGRMFVNGQIESQVQLDARGVIGGNAKLNGGIVLETGLNSEGSRLEPGNGTEPGTLIISGDLVMPGRSNLAFDIDQSKPAKNDSIKIIGNLTVNNTGNSLIINAVSPLETSILTLVTFTGTTNATASSFNVKGLEGIPYNLLIENNSIKIEITKPRIAGSVIWNGMNSGNWDFSSKNVLAGNNQDIFVPGDTISFNDNAINKNITINETMPVGGMNFVNNSDYKISGIGVISGNGGLTKTGEGKLSILTSANTFTGGIIIEGSTLEVSSLKDGGLPSSIGASTSNASNWIMKEATLQTTSQMATNRSMQVQGMLTVNNPTTSNSVLISGNITGTGISLELTGKGTLSLQGNNSFSEVTIKDGLLLLGSPDANRYSMGNSKITIEGGTLRMHDINSTGNTGSFSNTIEVPEGKNAKWDLPSRWGITGRLLGGGSITVNVPYVRTDLNGDWSAFTGTINFTGRDIRLNNSASRNISNATVNLSTGTFLYVASNGSGESSTGQTITFGALNGSGGIAGKNSLVIGGNNASSIYSGAINSGSGKLTKKGTGDLTLSGNNLYTGGTDVDEGLLNISNTEGSATGTGNINVKTGARLSGIGIANNNVTISTDAYLEPGDETATTPTGRLGTLTIGKNLILNGVLKMGVRKLTTITTDKLVVNGNLTISGKLIYENIDENATLPLGTELTLFAVTGSVNGQFSEMILPNTAEGTIWKTDELLLTGKIKVVSINSLNSATNSNSIKIYPNPATNYIIPQLPLQGIYLYSITDLSGRFLSKGNIESNSKIDIENLSEGSYLIKFSKENRTITSSFIKSH